jgi:hypothetical protein
MSDTHLDAPEDKDRVQKIQSLREMILNAERTIQGAKAMLLQLEGKKKTGRPRKSDEEDTVVQGTFNGQVMLGMDGKQYPVPANYASKSKLVEGDLLKLTITDNGMFLYKQIGPVARRHAIGIVAQDENENYFVVANSKPYKVLLASMTYFKAVPGDEVAIVLPADIDSDFAAIENILQKGAATNWEQTLKKAEESSSAINTWKKDLDITPEPTAEVTTPDAPTETTAPTRSINFVPTPAAAPQEAEDETELLSAWLKDLEEIEAELQTTKQE